jgi:diadenosine tetraphosphate (Ap4A) HIT family hydrolase/5-methylcytosine-specific restriction endonuclease McrA
MIKRLLEGDGAATDEEIALVLVNYDPSQIEYYKKITNGMVGPVLKNHHVVSKVRNTYRIENFELLTKEQKTELITLCNQSIEKYIKQRGDAIWAHRRRNRNSIPGSIRYEVLKRANFRCELCGISANEKALEVDHIVPKSLNGEDSLNNYQALCYTCNASKRNSDSADFRSLSSKFDYRESGCSLCEIDKRRLLAENRLAFLVYFPNSNIEGHSIVVPKRHFEDYFDITQPEVNAITALLHSSKELLNQKHRSISGFNINIDSTMSVGNQSLHTHVHIVPKYKLGPESFGLNSADATVK